MIDRLPGDIFRQGQVLNHTYEIEGVLGRGGTGEVYCARNQISGRIVAIKALNSRFSGNDDYIELMKREEQMRDVLNDAVVRYTECSRSDQGHVFLVMDFIDGPSMSDVMSERRMDTRELMIIAHRVAEGLVAAHARGIVHRDLSPDNVVLRDGAPEKATIIDFGIAKDTASGAKTIVGNEFAGKYEYAAPEQLEGKAEKRSDLYALGATLLAAYRGQVPFAGSTPGEIVRRKQTRVDTEGVPEPLKGLIEWLTAPSLEDRPANAEAVVARLNEGLRPAAGRGGRQPAQSKQAIAPTWGRRGGAGVVLLSVVLVLAGVGAWTAGLFDAIFGPALPIASPYVLSASLGPDGATTLSGNAPDAETALLLRQAFGAVAGRMPADDALPLADGMPGETWASDIAAALQELTGLPEWSLSVTDRTATVAGLAPDHETAAERLQALNDWSAKTGFSLDMDIKTGPRSLSVEAVQAIIEPFATCGPLTQAKAPGESYALGDTIALAGALLDTATGGTLQTTVEQSAGDRKVRIDATVLNEDLCNVRRVLPPLPADTMSIWLGYGDTGQVNLSGIYHAGDNPIVEVQLPADVSEASLWVVVVDNTGKVLNLLPNIYHDEHAIDAVGIVDGALRKVRVLHPLAALATDKTLLAVQVTDGDFGKSEVIAILSKKPLFEIRRPRDESVASFAEALNAIVRDDPRNILSVASRLLDSRP